MLTERDDWMPADRIGSDAMFDHERYWRYTRNTGLPRGYFDRPRLSADVGVWLVCAAIGAVLVIAWAAT